MRLKKFGVELIGVLGVLSFCLIACQANEDGIPTPSLIVPIASFTPILTSTSTSIPTETSTPVPRATLTPTFTQPPTSEPNEIHFPLPDLLINFGSFDSCEEEVSLPGQVWFLPYPYQEKLPLLVDEKISYYYPSWSPDGEWIAYLAVERKKPEESISEGFRGVLFGESDSIWVMRSDGSENHQLSESFPRLDAYSLHSDGVEVCDISLGVSYLSGWSPDGRWVVFRNSLAEKNGGNQKEGLYFLNVEKGESIVLENASAPGWFSMNEFAITNNTDKQIEIYQINSASPTMNYPFPSELASEYILSAPFALTGKNSLTFVVRQRIEAVEPMIWSLNPSTGEWTNLIQIDRASTFLGLGENKFVFCDSGSGLLFMDSNSLEFTGIINSHSPSSCFYSEMLTDNANFNIATFISQEETHDVWVTSLYGESPPHQKLFSLEDLGFQDDIFSQWFDLAWRP